MAGLGDEQAVERIAVVIGQLMHGQGVRDGDRQRQEAIGDHRRFQIVWCVELARASLDGDLPSDSGADIDDVFAVSNRASCGVRQELRIVQPPEEDVGVEEQHHVGSQPKAAARSSGSVSKSSAIRTRPFHWPPGRGGFSVRTGTSRKIGAPPLTMMMSSPSKAHCTNLESCNLASSILPCCSSMTTLRVRESVAAQASSRACEAVAIWCWRI